MICKNQNQTQTLKLIANDRIILIEFYNGRKEKRTFFVMEITLKQINKNIVFYFSYKKKKQNRISF